MKKSNDWLEMAQVSDHSPGLSLVPEFISPAEAQRLWTLIYGPNARWSDELKRRVEHFGFRYPYRRSRIKKLIPVDGGVLPPWAGEYAQLLFDTGLFPVGVPDQVIVNEYVPGQGIAPHIDDRQFFEDCIGTISLGCDVVMYFRLQGSTEKVPILLPERSLLILTGDARSKWEHAIPARRYDSFEGKEWARRTRVSITFRKVHREHVLWDQTDDILRELWEGRSVWLLAEGSSMSGIIEDGQPVRIEPVKACDVQIGDVVLAKWKGGNLILHQVNRIEDGRFLIANSRREINGWIADIDICGRFIGV